MKENQDQPADAAALRHRAETRLKRQKPAGGGHRKENETARLVHELQVHQIELEMQNEELQQARAQVEALRAEERQQARARLDGLLAQYTDLYDSAPTGYFSLDREGAILQANLTGAHMFGVERDRLVNQRFGLFVVEDDRRAFSAFLQKVFASQTRGCCEVSLPQKGLPPLVVRIEGARSADGNECRAVVLDITERRQAEETLHLQSAALTAAANAIIITDRNGTIRWINAAFTSLTGYGAEDAVGRNLRGLVKSGVHDQPFYQELWDTVLAGDVWRGEMTNRRKDGSLYPEQQTITPVKDARGEITHFVAIKLDLTEQRQLEAQFLQAQKMETVGRLAGGVAHDFNNLLTVINGTVDLVVTNLREGDPLSTDLNDIRLAGERAASLTRQLLAFSRKQAMKFEVLNLSTLVAALAGMLRRLIGQAVALVILPAQDVGSVMADPVQMEQVVMNLAANARDAMPNGGTLTIEMRDVERDEACASEHPSLQPGPHVMLAVSDTGVGMDEATRGRIFEPFFTTKERSQGTGLGLSTVYGIVRQSSGSIRVDSEVGKGTIFKIYLPRVEEVAHKVEPALTGTSVRGSETVLIVEDEEAVLHLARRILQLAGYKVLTAGNGEEALLLLPRHDGPVHLMLTDMVMPGMSGQDLARKIRDIIPRIKVIYTSGYPDGGIPHYRALGKAARFIGKPYTATQLRHEVREVLDS